ncbi:MAG: hypothetical protein HOY79_43715 [Streptomyces sp.]|nr:hypothetical protein [Streptomyces sp.]
MRPASPDAEDAPVRDDVRAGLVGADADCDGVRSGTLVDAAGVLLEAEGDVVGCRPASPDAEDAPVCDDVRAGRAGPDADRDRVRPGTLVDAPGVLLEAEGDVVGRVGPVARRWTGACAGPETGAAPTGPLDGAAEGRWAAVGVDGAGVEGPAGRTAPDSRSPLCVAETPWSASEAAARGWAAACCTAGPAPTGAPGPGSAVGESVAPTPAVSPSPPPEPRDPPDPLSVPPVSRVGVDGSTLRCTVVGPAGARVKDGDRGASEATGVTRTPRTGRGTTAGAAEAAGAAATGAGIRCTGGTGAPEAEETEGAALVTDEFRTADVRGPPGAPPEPPAPEPAAPALEPAVPAPAAGTARNGTTGIRCTAAPCAPKLEPGVILGANGSAPAGRSSPGRGDDDVASEPPSMPSDDPSRTVWERVLMSDGFCQVGRRPENRTSATWAVSVAVGVARAR